MTQIIIREPERPEHHDPNEERNWGSPSYLERLQDADSIIQHTPINERATSRACQDAYAELKSMQRPKWHICTECRMQFGNDQTWIKDDLSNLYGVCPRCKV